MVSCEDRSPFLFPASGIMQIGHPSVTKHFAIIRKTLELLYNRLKLVLAIGRPIYNVYFATDRCGWCSSGRWRRLQVCAQGELRTGCRAQLQADRRGAGKLFASGHVLFGEIKMFSALKRNIKLDDKILN